MAKRSKLNLLLVDSDPAFLFYLVELLKRSDATVRTASNGTAAMEIIFNYSLDLAIVDQRLPDLSGIDVLEAVQAEHPRSLRMLMTAYPDFDAAARAVNRAGIHRILIKPIEPLYLRSVLRQSLEQLQMQKEHSQLQIRLVKANKRLSTELKRRTRDAERFRRDLIGTRRELESIFWELAKVSRYSSLGLMMGVLAHDLRNPLTVLSGQLQMLSARVSEDETLGCRCAAMSRQVDRIQELVEGVSGMALNGGMADGLFDPVQAAEKALALTRKLFSSKEIDVVCDRPDETISVNGNLGQWVHILYKLLEYAGQHASQCRLLVTVEKMDDRAQVMIRFPGSGLARPLQRLISQRYPAQQRSRANSGSETIPEATTFYLCSRILQQYGGALEVEESAGETIFTIAQPLAAARTPLQVPETDLIPA